MKNCTRSPLLQVLFKVQVIFLVCQRKRKKYQMWRTKMSTFPNIVMWYVKIFFKPLLPCPPLSILKRKVKFITRFLHNISSNIFSVCPDFEKTPSKLMEDEDKHSLLPCEFCGASCTIESLEKHQMLCGSNLEACPRCQKNFTFGQLSTHVCSQTLNKRGILVLSAAIKYS